MDYKELEVAYQRLDYEEYESVIKDTMIPLFDTFDGEFITLVDENTKFSIQKHYHRGIFMGYNIYAAGKLIETRSTLKKARKFLYKLVHQLNQEVSNP